MSRHGQKSVLIIVVLLVISYPAY
ncbi:hypothetical protein [Escherichia coli]|nr:hypothetical protein [Escherichia coli]